MLTPIDPNVALRELRKLVATYLEGSDDAERAAELLAAIETQVSPIGPAHSTIAEDVARKMFGCTAEAIESSLVGKSRRDVAMYALGTLSNAQELIHRRGSEGSPDWWVRDLDANTIRQLINIAKYAVDKAVPR